MPKSRTARAGDIFAVAEGQLAVVDRAMASLATASAALSGTRERFWRVMGSPRHSGGALFPHGLGKDGNRLWLIPVGGGVVGGIAQGLVLGWLGGLATLLILGALAYAIYRWPHVSEGG